MVVVVIFLFCRVLVKLAGNLIRGEGRRRNASGLALIEGPRRNIFLGGRNFVKKGICETTGAKRLQTNETRFRRGIWDGAPKIFEF